jgi:hypothetical protein
MFDCGTVPRADRVGGTASMARAAYALLSMCTRRFAALRNGILALSACYALHPAPACAEGGPQLILPLVVALAVGSTAKNVADQISDAGPRSRRGILRYLPAQIGIPDAYADAEQDFIEVHHTIEHVDADRIVWLDLLGRRRRGWMASVIYDEETQVPLGRTTNLVGIVAEYKF